MNGISMNGISMNGISMNGISMNGISMNVERAKRNLAHFQAKLMRAAEALVWNNGDTPENWNTYNLALERVKALESIITGAKS